MLCTDIPPIFTYDYHIGVSMKLLSTTELKRFIKMLRTDIICKILIKCFNKMLWTDIIVT